MLTLICKDEEFDWRHKRQSDIWIFIDLESQKAISGLRQGNNVFAHHNIIDETEENIAMLKVAIKLCNGSVFETLNYAFKFDTLRKTTMTESKFRFRFQASLTL